MSVSYRFPPFLARPPWWGGDLQTLRNILRPEAIPRLDGFAGERLEFPAADGSGDVLLGMLNQPATPTTRPLVILLHGLTGSEDSAYIRASARHFLDLGYAVLRLNMRGAGPSRRRCRFHYHAGRSDDLRTVIGRLDGRLAARGLFVAGFSLGGNVLLKYLGETGRLAPLLGAASISAPIDLKATQQRMMRRRNRVYHDYMLARMKEEFVAPAGMLSTAERHDLDAIDSVYAFDDRIVAPRNGFAGADDYYARCRALAFLAGVRTPTLVIHALNDPWIPGHAYRSFDWSTNRQLVPLLPRGGGHVGFHGLGNAVAWHNRCMAAFLDRLVR